MLRNSILRTNKYVCLTFSAVHMRWISEYVSHFSGCFGFDHNPSHLIDYIFKVVSTCKLIVITLTEYLSPEKNILETILFDLKKKWNSTNISSDSNEVPVRRKIFKFQLDCSLMTMFSWLIIHPVEMNLLN